MFCTIISDAYTTDEREKIFSYIDDLCSPTDNYGWSSNGIYCYWNYYTKEILYIGLARDLGYRFKQHNGLVSCNENSCKINEINDYFNNYEKLGFSIIVQSPLVQMNNFRNSDLPAFDLDSETNDAFRNDLSSIEGNLIRGHEINFGSIPRWNKVNGASGRSDFKDFSIFKNLTLQEDGILNTRVPLRELSENPTFAFYETTLHGIRHLNMHRSDGVTFRQMIDEFKAIDPFVDVHQYDKLYEYILKDIQTL